MGCFSSYCQICGVATNHHGLVPMGNRMYKIYRGEANETEKPYPFVSINHDWLKRCVAIPLESDGSPLLGNVCDGDLTTNDGQVIDVEDGVGEAVVVHEACWNLAGRGDYSTFAHVAESSAWKEIEEKYHKQWFPWNEISDPIILLDPTVCERNRERILSMLQTPLEETTSLSS
mmetsp:Transcript_8736/g.12126  ORF Transcript_8736/g.12126 Transcript_8736/m.12126 type:complete len:174 (+) Transcript_8736:21-542(+)